MLQDAHSAAELATTPAGVSTDITYNASRPELLHHMSMHYSAFTAVRVYRRRRLPSSPRAEFEHFDMRHVPRYNYISTEF